MSLLARRLSAGADTSPGGGGGSFDPLSIGWYAAFWAEDPNWTDPGDGNAVSSWRNDGSGDWGAAAQATGTKQPLYRSSVAALNSKPAIDFDGSNDELKTSAGTAQEPSTGGGPLVSVMIADVTPNSTFAYLHDRRAQVGGDPGTNRFIVGMTSGNGWRIYVDSGRDGGTATSGAHLFVFDFWNNPNSYLYVDGVTIQNGVNIGWCSLDGLTLGAGINAGAFVDARIAFMGLKVGALTAQELSDIEAWATDHYGITVS